MEKFYDIESESIVTIDQLEKEFMDMKKYNPIDFDDNYTFDMYVTNCLTIHGGTLEPVEN